MEQARIMIVEDDELLAEHLQIRIQELGYEVCCVISSASNIITEFRQGRPDLIVMDIVLEGDVDGLEAARQIHEIANTPVVFLTAYIDDEKLKRAIAAGNCSYLLKPPDYKTLRATITLALEGQQGQAYMDQKSNNDLQMTKLAEANVRMILLTDLIVGFRECENEYLHSGDFTSFIEEVLEGLQTATQSEYAAYSGFSENATLENFITLGISTADRAKLKSMPEGRGVLAAFYKKGEITRIENIAEHPDSVGFPPGHPNMTTLMGGPVRFKGRIGGVLYLANKRNSETYSLSDENILQVFSNIIESALERYYLLDDLQKQHLALQEEKENHLVVINQLQDAQDQLLQSEKMASIGQLAAGVAHEINNPVGYINSNIGTLKQYIGDVFSLVEAYEKAEPLIDDGAEKSEINEVSNRIEIDYLKEDLQDLIKESEEGVLRVKQIVQDLKDFSHVDEAEWQWADLHHGIDSTLNIVRNEVKYKAEVIKEYGDLPQIECIISQLNQVFMNILVNAAHAIDEHGKIRITSGVEGNKVWVNIEDSGKGMDDATRKRIFEPFFTTKPVGTGTGLGLSLSYGIIQKHGGDITVKSESGVGTQFHIVLPIEQEEQMVDANVS